MHTNVDRRAVGVRRVSVERMVDICDSHASTSAFQGRSLDVSGRGMQLCASHLPELGTKLVLRFQEPGGEVIAEGDVAWRKERSAGAGEFGVRFTALDSKSVRALKALCQHGSSAAASREPEVSDEDEAPAVPSAPLEEEHDTERMPAVAPAVHLHLSGRAPLRAQVRRRSAEGLELGSQLEFLRIGRTLEVEDLARGERREARIDALDVSVDRSSHVPELIVAVRYDAKAADAQASAPVPAPVVRPSERATAAEAWARQDVAAEHESDGGAPDEDGDADDASDERVCGEDGEDDEEAAEPGGLEPLRARLNESWISAGEALRWASVGCVRLGRGASRGAGWLWARARRARGAPRAAVPLRRTTPKLRATRPQPLRPHARPLRPQNPNHVAAAPARRARVWALGAAFIGALMVGAWLGRGARPDAAASPAAALPPAPAAAAPAAVPAPAAAGESVEASGAEVGEPGEVVARLPLFGPSSLGAATAASADEREPALARVKVPDERFDAPKKKPSAPPKTEFASGRLHLPIVYRLRLDQPGESLRGERTASGFDVLIPGRRVMESGAGIARRDNRIAKVSTHREGGGTRVSFKFKKTVPPYKVRLRKDFVEFFISSP